MVERCFQQMVGIQLPVLVEQAVVVLVDKTLREPLELQTEAVAAVVVLQTHKQAAQAALV